MKNIGRPLQGRRDPRQWEAGGWGPFWSWSWSSGENSHLVKELVPQGRAIMATGLRPGVTQEGRDPPTPLPCHPLSAPHMPRICPYTLPSSFIWCFQERKEGLLTSIRENIIHHHAQHLLAPRLFSPSLHPYTPLLFWRELGFLPPSGIFPLVFDTSVAEACW